MIIINIAVDLYSMHMQKEAKKRNENTAGDDDEREKTRVETCIIEDAFLFYNNTRTNISVYLCLFIFFLFDSNFTNNKKTKKR